MPDMNINTGLLTKPLYTVATLPSATGAYGQILWVSDLTVNPLVGAGQTAAGGGTTLGRVLSNGTAWKIYDR